MSQEACNDLPRRMRLRAVLLSILSAVMVNLIPTGAWAATHVEGAPDALLLRVENAPLIEVLNALRVQVRYRLPDLTATKTGVYSGTLHQVLARILDGYDYVIAESGHSMQVVILGASAAPGAAPPPLAPVGSPAFPTAPSGK